MTVRWLCNSFLLFLSFLRTNTKPSKPIKRCTLDVQLYMIAKPICLKLLQGFGKIPEGQPWFSSAKVRNKASGAVIQSAVERFCVIFHKRRECLHQLWLWKSILLQMHTHLSCWKWTGLHAGLSLTKARGENFSLFQYIKYFYFPCQSQIASENITETITNHKCASLFAAWLNISVKTGGWGGSIVSPSVYLTHHTLSGHLTVELS